MKLNRNLTALLPIVLAFFGVVLTPLIANAAANVTSIQSHNWAGYQVSIPNNSNSAAMMTWRVPNIDCTQNGNPMSGAVGIFPGLGGVAEGDLLAQLGTANQCSNGQLSTYAWWEVAPTIAEQPLSNSAYPVYADDDMAAEVVYNNGTYQFYMNDSTQNWQFQNTWTGTTTMPQSAECIVEDGDSALLPQFTTINISNCQWNSGQGNGAQPISTGVNLTQNDVWGNQGSFLIRKTQTSGLGNDGASFNVDWVNYG